MKHFIYVSIICFVKNSVIWICASMNIGVKVNFEISNKKSKLLEFVDILFWLCYELNIFVIFSVGFRVTNEKKNICENMNRLLELIGLINWSRSKEALIPDKMNLLNYTVTKLWVESYHESDLWFKLLF